MSIMFARPEVAERYNGTADIELRFLDNPPACFLDARPLSVRDETSLLGTSHGLALT